MGTSTGGVWAALCSFNVACWHDWDEARELLHEKGMGTVRLNVALQTSVSGPF